MDNIVKKKINNYDVLYFTNSDLWQKPVITEKQIFENLFFSNNLPHNYIAFPWANYIDNKWTKKYNNLEKIINDEILNKKKIDTNKTYFTVCQHIEFRNYIDKFLALNIKYIFTPHKMIGDEELENKYDIQFIPISLFPVQYNENNIFNEIKDKKYLANFIGNINHNDMLSNIRGKILSCFNEKLNCYIKTNNTWFYQNHVYSSDKASQFNTQIQEHLYKSTLNISKFSLSPSGTGPNSIRLWESLSYGCIPVILSDKLVLPNINVNYDDFLIILKEEKINELYDYLLTFTDDKIEAMSKKCIEIFTSYFSPKTIHKQVLHFFLKNETPSIINETPCITETPSMINETPCITETHCINETPSNKQSKVILITQYYKVNTTDKEYERKRQEEINYCLQKNIENQYIDEIHLLIQEDYELDFIVNKNNINIVKSIISKERLNFLDVFIYANEKLKNEICILSNSDIYLDKSIELIKNVDFTNLFIALNRYENNNDSIPALLNGLEINESEYKYCREFLQPFQESIWSQDVWIWKSPFNYGVSNEFDFNLGTVGCDNYIAYLMDKLKYKVLNCSKIICANHYDRLSIVVLPKYGISKGNISKKQSNLRVGNMSTYIFLNNQSDIPDKFTTKIDTIFTNNKPKITELSFTKNISEINVSESQINSSSFSEDKYKPYNSLFENPFYWEPNINDINPYIQFNFENIYEIAVIDIMGKPLSITDLKYGYVKKFKLEYYDINHNWVNIPNVFTGIEINNANYIKKIYLHETIKCFKIKIFPLEYENIRALKIKLYKNDCPKITDSLFTKNISEITVNESQIIASSFSDDKYKPCNSLFEKPFYWEPNINDIKPYIQFNFENIYEIAIIDIIGYLKKFKLEYLDINKNWINIPNIYSGIEISKTNYINKIYLPETIKCIKIKINPLEYENIRSLKIKLYKIEYPKKNWFPLICNNVKYFNKFDYAFLDYKYMNEIILNNEETNNIKYSYKVNLLGEKIQPGVCLFTYVMNRNQNIYNNIASWMKQNVQQIIILDWNSKEDLNDYIKSLNDDRILYVRVINEKHFVRTFAQNLAGKFCKFDKIIKLDSDILLSDNFFENHPLQPGHFYVGEWLCARDKNEKYVHGNVYLYLDDYLMVNGYNEFIKDYGWEDTDFTIRLLLCGLTKKVFNLNYLYHVPHGEELRIVNLNGEKNTKNNSLFRTFTNKFCLRNIVWNNDYQTQKYNIFKINTDFIICDRIKGNEYEFDKDIYESALKETINLFKSWNML